MTTKKTVPFFTELGLLLNLVRSIRFAINKETSQNPVDQDGLGNIRYIRNNSFSRLQDSLRKLEIEMAYFFTDSGARKATDSMFDTQLIQQKFIAACKSLSNDYFNLKTNRKEKPGFEQKAFANPDAEIFSFAGKRPAVVN